MPYYRLADHRNQAPFPGFILGTGDLTERPAWVRRAERRIVGRVNRVSRALGGTPRLAFAVLAGMTAAFAQAPMDSPALSRRGGIQLHSLATHAGYSSQAFPLDGGSVLRDADLGWDLDVGARATFGWNRFGRQNNFSLTYTPSYTARARYSEWNTVNHALTLTAGRKAGHRWSLNLAASAMAGDLENYLFTPTVFGRVAEIPATFDELANAILAGKFTNDQLASILTGAPVLESPARVTLYGDRVLSASLRTGFSYAPTARWTWFGGLSGGRYQHLGDRGTTGLNPRYPYAVDRTTTAGADAGFSYAVSPRTQLGFQASGQRTFSTFLDGYSSTAALSLGRTLSRRWFVQLQGGAGKNILLRNIYQYSDRVQPIGGLTLGMRTSSHTLLLSHERGLAEGYTGSAGANDVSNAAWNWRRRGQAWGLHARLGRHRLEGSGFLEVSGIGAINAWLGGAGVTRTLSRTLSLQTDYAYITNTARLAGAPYQLKMHHARVTMMWVPLAEGIF